MSEVPDVTLKLDASVSVDSDGDVVKTFKFGGGLRSLSSSAESLLKGDFSGTSDEEPLLGVRDLFSEDDDTLVLPNNELDPSASSPFLLEHSPTTPGRFRLFVPPTGPQSPMLPLLEPPSSPMPPFGLQTPLLKGLKRVLHSPCSSSPSPAQHSDIISIRPKLKTKFGSRLLASLAALLQ